MVEELANEIKKEVTNLVNDGTFIKSAVPLLKEEIAADLVNIKNEVIAKGKEAKQELLKAFSEELAAAKTGIVKGVKTTISTTKKLVKKFGEQNAESLLGAAREGGEALKKLVTNFQGEKRANITERGLLFLLMVFLAIGALIGYLIWGVAM